MKKREIFLVMVSCLMSVSLVMASCTTPKTTPAPDTTVPMVSNTNIANFATGVPVNTKVSASFSEAMDPLTLTAATFTLMQGANPFSGAGPVSGIVTYTGVAATFTPNVALIPNTEYTATITTGAKDLAGNALASPYTWKWTTAKGPY